MWTTIIAKRGKTPTLKMDTVTLLVDYGASETFIDDQMTPGIKNPLTNYCGKLKFPRKVLGAGGNKLIGEAERFLWRIITHSAERGVHHLYPTQ